MTTTSRTMAVVSTGVVQNHLKASPDSTPATLYN